MNFLRETSITKECHKVPSPMSYAMFMSLADLPEGCMGITWGLLNQGKTVALFISFRSVRSRDVCLQLAITQDIQSNSQNCLSIISTTTTAHGHVNTPTGISSAGRMWYLLMSASSVSTIPKAVLKIAGALWKACGLLHSTNISMSSWGFLTDITYISISWINSH